MPAPSQSVPRSVRLVTTGHQPDWHRATADAKRGRPAHGGARSWWAVFDSEGNRVSKLFPRRRLALREAGL